MKKRKEKTRNRKNEKGQCTVLISASFRLRNSVFHDAKSMHASTFCLNLRTSDEIRTATFQILSVFLSVRGQNDEVQIGTEPASDCLQTSDRQTTHHVLRT